MRKKPKVLTLAKIRKAQNAAALAAKTLAEIVVVDDAAHQLAICVGALRTIAGSSRGDVWTRGVARGALRRAGVS